MWVLLLLMCCLLRQLLLQPRLLVCARRWRLHRRHDYELFLFAVPAWYPPLNNDHDFVLI